MTTYLLSENEYRRFTGEAVPRRWKKDGDQEPVAADSAVDEILRALVKDASPTEFRQHVVLVAGYRGDGLTWSATEAVRSVAERNPTYRFVPFTGASAAGPEIVKYIPARTVKRLLRRAGIMPAQAGRWRDVAIFLVVFLLFFGPLIAVGSGDGPVHWTAAVPLALAAALAGVLANHVRPFGDTDPIPEPSELFRKENRQALKPVVEELAARLLGLPKPGCFVVDNFAELDPLTGVVVKEAIEAQPGRTVGTILWLVFEYHDAAQLAARHASSGVIDPPLSNGNCSRYAIEPMSETERLSVARRRGLPPERALRHRFVKDLVEGVSDDAIADMAKAFNQVQRLEQSPKAVTPSMLLRFLTHNSNDPTWDLSASEIVTLFSAKDTEGLLATVLHPHLRHSGLNVNDVRRMLNELADTLPTLVVRETGVRPIVRVTPMAADVLEKSEQGAVPPTMIHLFWFVRWHRKFGESRGQSRHLLKLLFHVERARLSEDLLQSEAGLALAEEFVRALVAVTQESLRAAFFGRAITSAELMLGSVRMLSGSNAAPAVIQKFWSKVLLTAWQVYASTASDELFRQLVDVIFDLNARLDVPAVADAAAPPPLITWYLRLNNVGREAIPGVAHALAGLFRRDEALARRLSLYMLFRTAAFVEVFEPLATPEVLTRCLLPTFGELMHTLATFDLTRAYEEASAREDLEAAILDQEILKDLGDFYRRSGSLPEARTVATALGIKALGSSRRTGAQGMHVSLLDRALSIEAFALALEDSLRLARRMSSHMKPNYEGGGAGRLAFQSNLYPGELCTDLNDLLRVPGEEFRAGVRDDLRADAPVPTAVLDMVDRALLSAAIAWEELGLPAMRNRVLSVRAFYQVDFSDADPNKPHTFEPVVGALGPALAQSGFDSIVCHMQLAALLRPQADLAAIHLFHCMDILLQTQVPDEILFLILAATAQTVLYLPMAAVAPTRAAVSRLLSDATRNRFVESFGGIAVGMRIVQFLLESARLSNDPDLKKEVGRFVEMLLHDARFGEAGELQVLVDFHQLGGAPFKGSAKAADKLLEGWSERQAHWTYPSVLSHVFEAKKGDRRFITLCLDVLLKHHEWFRTTTTAADLLLQVAAVAAFTSDAETKETVVALLKEHVVPRIGMTVNAEAGLQAYRLLILMDEKGSLRHRMGHAAVLEVKLKRDRGERLATMIEQGHFYGVFDSYWRGLMVYDLPSVQLDSAFCGDCLKLLESTDPFDITPLWRRLKNIGVDLVTGMGGGAAVVHDSILFSQLAFSSRVRECPELSEIRTHMNRAARRRIEDFLGIIERTASVPAGLRALIREHREHLHGVAGTGA